VGLARRVTPLTAALKPRVSIARGQRRLVWLIVLANGDASRLVDELQRLYRIALQPPLPAVGYFVRLRAMISAVEQGRLLAHPRLLAIEPYVPPVVHDEAAGLIVAGQLTAQGIPQGAYLEWLGGHRAQRRRGHYWRGGQRYRRGACRIYGPHPRPGAGQEVMARHGHGRLGGWQLSGSA
jgi:hypothetical protein